MKTKISVSIDSELLNIIKDCSDSDIDSIVQDALATFFGVKQIWVRSDTLDPIPVEIPKQISVVDTSIKDAVTREVSEIPKQISASANNIKVPHKKGRKPGGVLKIWNKVNPILGTEFTTDDYWSALKTCGVNYKDSARYSTILDHLRLVEETGVIIKINDRPKTYRKIQKEQTVSEPEKEQTVSEPEKEQTVSEPEKEQIGLKLFE